MSNKTKIGTVSFEGFGDYIFKALSHSEHFQVAVIAVSFPKAEKIPQELQFIRDWKELYSSAVRNIFQYFYRKK